MHYQTKKRKMMVLVVFRKAKSNGMGGVENYFKVLRPYLPDWIHYFELIKATDSSKAQNFKRLIQDCLKFNQVIKHYDLVQVNPSLRRNSVIRDAILLNLARMQKKRIVVFFRGWDKAFENELRKNWLYIFKKLYFSADAIIVLSNAFKKSLMAMGYKGRIVLETTIADDTMFPKNIDRARNDKIPINILFLSRIIKEKGIYEAIDTVSVLLKKGINVNMTVAGDGNELESVKKYAKHMLGNNIRFLGYVRGVDKANAFNLADIFLFPSYEEGMPNAVLEAMAFGLPVITRPVGGLKDFFINNRMGYLTDSLNPNVFSNLIEKLIFDNELRFEIGSYNHKFAKANFRASSASRRFNTLYDEILSI